MQYLLVLCCCLRFGSGCSGPMSISVPRRGTWRGPRHGNSQLRSLGVRVLASGWMVISGGEAQRDPSRKRDGTCFLRSTGGTKVPGQTAMCSRTAAAFPWDQPSGAPVSSTRRLAGEKRPVSPREYCRLLRQAVAPIQTARPKQQLATGHCAIHLAATAGGLLLIQGRIVRMASS